jgi:hypothetical protein
MKEKIAAEEQKQQNSGSPSNAILKKSGATTGQNKLQ